MHSNQYGFFIVPDAGSCFAARTDGRTDEHTHASTSGIRSSLLGKISDRSTRVKDLPRDSSLDSKCCGEKVNAALSQGHSLLMPPHTHTHTCIPIMRHFRDSSAPSCERLTHLYTFKSLQKTAECHSQIFSHGKMVKFRATPRYFFAIKPPYRPEMLLAWEKPVKGQIKHENRERGGGWGSGVPTWGSSVHRLITLRRPV